MLLLNARESQAGRVRIGNQGEIACCHVRGASRRCGNRKATEAPRHLLAAEDRRASAPKHALEDPVLKDLALVRHGDHLCCVESSRWARAQDCKETSDIELRGAPKYLPMMDSMITCIVEAQGTCR